MFFEELQVNYSELEALMAEDLGKFEAAMDRYVIRKYYIGDTGINRKTFLDWEAQELMPYEYLEEGWRKFSFIEWVWLECINEFRHLGVSIERIKEIKSVLFTINVDNLLLSFKSELMSHQGQIDRREELEAAVDDPDTVAEIKKRMPEELQISPFFLILLFQILKDANVCIVYGDNYCACLEFGAKSNTVKNNDTGEITALPNLLDESFIVINLRKIVTRIFQKPLSGRNDGFVIDFLSPKERIILDQIRTSNAKEIRITFDKEGDATHIKVDRNRISKEILYKVARYLKKGDYKTVQFTTRDGQLIVYDETEIIKLNK
jgi:DNA-binding transcriptional MerR regulator